MTVQRLQFEQPIDSRDGTLTKDSRTCNALYEKDGSEVSLEKRPGLLYQVQIVPTTPPAISVSQGLANYSGYLIAVINNTIYRVDPTSLVVAAVGGISATTNKCYFTRMTRDTKLVFHNTINAYTYTIAGGLTTVTLPEAGPFVPGMVYLDDYVFIGSSSTNLIYSSNQSDPNTWSSLASVGFVQTTDTLVGICKHLNYLVAFGKTSAQFYYDSGNGSNTLNPLAVAQSYTIEIGCANGDSIVSADNTVCWVGYSRTNGKSVYIMDGVSPVKVSTPAIDRALENNDWTQPVSAYCYKYNGHTLYILTLHAANLTLVYDMTVQSWYQWTQYAQASSDQPNPGQYIESYFRPTFYTSLNNKSWVLDDDLAVLYTLDQNTYQDNGQPIYYRIVTEIYDNGSTHRKFYGRMEIVGDKVPGATMSIRHTGDDYNTFSTFRTVDLNASRSQIYLGGSDRRRAWEFVSTSNTALRLDAAEIDFRLGELDQEQNMGRR